MITPDMSFIESIELHPVEAEAPTIKEASEHQLQGLQFLSNPMPSPYLNKSAKYKQYQIEI